MKTLKAAVAKYNGISLILRILVGLAVGVVLALVAPGAGWVAEFGSLFVGALKGIAPVLVFVIVASALAQGSSRLDRRFGTVIWLYMLTTFLAAAIAVVLACVIGYFTSKRLSTPIQRITNTARQLRNGDLTARSGVRGSDEIGQLGETFDDMATSLERDLKLEHRLTGDVAHELRTPLMAMQATVEAMQDGVLPADDEHFETVAAEVRRLSRLVDAMLKLSRLENGSTELKTERTDVVYLIRSLVTSQHQLFHEKGLHLRFVDESQYGELNADIDPDLIREAVVNLMSNAMRYTDEDGWVMVTVRQDKSDVPIAVQDTGIGIAKEDIPQTFSRFWRSDVSRERVSGGLGVGLSLTKEIVDKHNGTILVESELGKGTTFTLRIPQNRGRRNLAQAIQEG